MVNDWTLADDRMEEMLRKNCIKHVATYIVGCDDSKLDKETRCKEMHNKIIRLRKQKARLDKSQGTK